MTFQPGKVRCHFCGHVLPRKNAKLVGDPRSRWGAKFAHKSCVKTRKEVR